MRDRTDLQGRHEEDLHPLKAARTPGDLRHETGPGGTRTHTKENNMKKKAYPTADMEIKTLLVGEEVVLRDVTGGPTPWRRMVVEEFVDEDRVLFRDPEKGESCLLATEDLEIDLPG